MPGSDNCVSFQTFKKSTPPIPVSCNETTRWRNRVCLPAGTPSTSATASQGVEYDWMQFLRGVNTQGNAKISMGDLMSVFAAACTGNVTDGCNNQFVSWVASPGRKGLVDGVALFFGTNDPRRNQFLVFGDSYGVSTSTSP